MEGIIYHFLHKHPLTLTLTEQVDHRFLCAGCNKSLSPGPIYRCRYCDFYLHKSCTELPEEIQHFFHPCPLVLRIRSFVCHACFESNTGFSYYCKSCDFDMHVRCARRPNIKSNEEIIQHFTHWHPLKLVDEKDLQVGCGICEKLCFDSASSAAYGCKQCNFFAHKSCMNIPRQMNHSFHPSCPLILQTTPFYFKCKGCDEGSNSQLVYRCGKCKFDLDFKCALLPTLDQSKDAHQIQYVGHKHPLLALHDNNNKKHNFVKFGSEVGCSVCEEKCSLDEEDHPCFGCERCRYFIHKQCIATEFRPKIHHYFHPLHPLILSSIPPDEGAPFHCSACGGSIDKFLLVYGCVKCRFYLHADCAMPKLLVKYEGHSHHLTYIEKTCAPVWCQICLDPTRNCFFGCVACHFYIHLHCHPSAPKTITHNSHLHPLTLRRSPFKFERISPEYWEESDRFNEVFYCDVCEEKRYKLESVYYCSECKFIAETRCIISELLPSVTGSEGHHTIDNNSALEASIASRTNEIAQLKEEERPLALEIEKLEATLQALKSKHTAITWKLGQFETDRVLWKHQLDHNLEGKKKAAEASTSKGLPADILS